MARVIKDSGWTKAFEQALRKMVVTVGIHEEDSARNEGALTNAEVGIKNEFGVGKVPERSFLRSTADEKESEYRKLLIRALHNEMKGRRSLEYLGMKIASDVKNKIRSSIPPPNAPETVAKKGSTTTLIHHGEMLNAVDYKVER